MLNKSTDSEWEKWGATDPYFGVITFDNYRSQNLTEEEKNKFFQTGRQHVDDVMKNIRRYIDPDFKPTRALDFGCGVGRLTLPISNFAEQVVGIDISEGMLNEARRNCMAQGVRNVRFYKSDDNLSLAKNKFDFIHSFIVFQHIPNNRGELIFNKLLNLLTEKGVCVVHFTYAKSKKVHDIAYWAMKYLPFTNYFVNILRGRKFLDPRIQMNDYDLNKIFKYIQRAKVHDFYAQYTNHGGALGLFIYFQK